MNFVWYILTYYVLICLFLVFISCAAVDVVVTQFVALNSFVKLVILIPSLAVQNSPMYGRYPMTSVLLLVGIVSVLVLHEDFFLSITAGNI